MPPRTNIYPKRHSLAMAIEFRHKHRLRQKEILAISTELNDKLGTTVFSDSDNVEVAESRDLQILFVDNKIAGIITGERPMLTVHGLIRYGASKRYVTVDMGAVPFVCNGADVMTPGIVDADSLIAPGDYVWIRDERNKKPLAIGIALMSGDELRASEKGKGVKMLHWVGDELWSCKG